jgi:cell division protein FtsI/penicillin-binding protein 2
VFKIITAAAALENNHTPNDYYCKGSISFNATTFNCNATKAHKTIHLTDALSKSCNTYFIKMGVDIGGKQLIDTAKLFRFGQATDFGNGFKTDSGVLPNYNELVSNADVANLAFGQGRLTATPIQIAAMLSTIGNDGFYIEPTLIKGKINNDGILYEENKINKVKIINESTCHTIKSGLEKTVTDGTGTKAQSDLLECCAKTATAQSGRYDENGEEILYCWFAAFFPKENPQYTICIMKENGSSGGSDCGPVFKEIAENILLNF